MKKEFIFSVGEIFGKVLDEDKVSHYYIGPYQRGYKWASTNYYDEVPQLLIDIYEAFKDRDTDEYYLQFITVLKSTVRNERVYEVIDGQQRLTTLGILYHRFNRRDKSIPNIGFGKLEYSRNQNVKDKLFEQLDGLSNDDSQDMYYIQGAANCIDVFVSKLEDSGELWDYADFVTDRVKLIVNEESELVSAEEIFANLNDNMVLLTNAYLIKGLLLTKGVQMTDKIGHGVSYFNILNQRRINGRMWDEIQNWIEQPHITYYFFRDNGMESLLSIVIDKFCAAHQNRNAESELVRNFKSGFEQSDREISDFQSMRLFNKYNEQIKNETDALECLRLLIHTYKKLRTIYEDAQLYNLLGFSTYRSGSSERNSMLMKIIDKNLNEIKSDLAEESLNVLPDISTDEPTYQRGRDKLLLLLLSFSVFPEHTVGNYRFDFVSFGKNNWSYEHIRPQNPKYDSIDVSDCKEQVKQLWKDYPRADANVSISNEDNKAGDNTISVDEQISQGKIINRELIDILYADIDDDHLHSMGNMALLTNGQNSSLSNNPYIWKRAEVMNKIKNGEFVPLHTFNAFSKSLNMHGLDKAFDTGMFVWTAKDIEAQAAWMSKRNNEIIKGLKALMNKKADTK